MVVPLWAILLIFILVVIVAWKLIKFAIKIMLVLILILIIFAGLDYLGVFDAIQNLIAVIA